MRSLASAYAVLALLAMPAVLWAQEATTPAPPPTTATAPPAASATPEAPAPEPAPPAAEPAAEPAPEQAKPAAADAPAEVSDARPAPVARAAVSGGVTIQDFAFSPATITVDVGDTVTWTNRDEARHSATAEDGSFDTGLLARGESGSHTFDRAGSFPYQCTPHPNMTGTVVVRAADDGGAAAAGGGDSTGAGTNGSTGSSSSPSGSTLPATGLSVAIVALGGVLLLAAGALLRRRVEDWFNPS